MGAGGGIHLILDFTTGDSLGLWESNAAEPQQMATTAPGCTAQKYHTGSPQCTHMEHSKSLFGSWISNCGECLLTEMTL